MKAKLKNKRLLKKLIAEDCELQGQYYYRGKTCAIGRLAIDCGISKEMLKKINRLPIYITEVKDIETVCRAIQNKFGLSPSMLDEIQYRNDRYYDPEPRRDGILRYINNL